MSENLDPGRDQPAEPPETPPTIPPNSGDRWDERADRREARAQRRAERWSGGAPWIGGVILIVLGLVFLAQNLNLLTLNFNWWALFILIPAVGSFAAAQRQFSQSGRWDSGARGALIGGLILTLVAFAFLFNLNWGRIWPLFLILAGIGALLSALER